MPGKSFSKARIAAFDQAKILGVRSGDEHKYTGVWVVVVDDRVFVRSWNDKPTGWFRAFKAEPRGSVQLNGKDIRVRTSAVRSEKMRAAVSAAYGEKYNTKGSQKWVTGFAEPERAINTLELKPA